MQAVWRNHFKIFRFFFSVDDSETIKALPSPTDDTFAEPSPAIDLNKYIKSNATPNLSVDSRSNERLSTFYVDLPAECSSNQCVDAQSGRIGNNSESNDEFSDISEVGRCAQFDYDSEFSQISDTNWAKYDQQLSFPSSIDNRSINSLRVFLDQPDSNFTQKHIPDIRQPNFGALWQTLLEIVGNTNHDVWHARKFPANHSLLLSTAQLIFIIIFFHDSQIIYYCKLVTVDKQRSAPRKVSTVSHSLGSHQMKWVPMLTVPLHLSPHLCNIYKYNICIFVIQADNNGNSSVKTIRRPSTGSAGGTKAKQSNDGWQITLNQFIATTIPVTIISDCFTRRTFIKEGIERLQKQRRKNFQPSPKA